MIADNMLILICKVLEPHCQLTVVYSIGKCISDMFTCGMILIKYIIALMDFMMSCD